MNISDWHHILYFSKNDVSLSPTCVRVMSRIRVCFLGCTYIINMVPRAKRVLFIAFCSMSNVSRIK